MTMAVGAQTSTAFFPSMRERGAKGNDYQCQQAFGHTMLLFRMVSEPVESWICLDSESTECQSIGEGRTVAPKCGLFRFLDKESCSHDEQAASDQGYGLYLLF